MRLRSEDVPRGPDRRRNARVLRIHGARGAIPEATRRACWSECGGLRAPRHDRQPGHGNPEPRGTVRRREGPRPIGAGPGSLRQGAGPHCARRRGRNLRRRSRGAAQRSPCARGATRLLHHRSAGDHRGRRRDHDRVDLTSRHAPVLGAPNRPRPRGRSRSRWVPRSSDGTSSTTGTTGSCTRAGTCGRSTSCTTRASATTSRPRCASRWPTRSGRSLRTGCCASSASDPRSCRPRGAST